MRDVLIVEDLPDVREWLSALIRTAMPAAAVVEAVDLRSARRWLQAGSRGAELLAFVDLGLPDGSGLDLVRELRDRRSARVFVSTVFDDDDHLMRALSAGAEGYLLKDRDREETLRLIRGIDAGEAAISPNLARRILARFQQGLVGRADEAEPARLTERETEVLRLIGRGLTLREVAGVLTLSTHTAATHVKSIYAKLGIASRAEAALEASRRNLT